jgi:hypothetical protein
MPDSNEITDIRRTLNKQTADIAALRKVNDDQQLTINRQKSINELGSFVDDLLASIMLWKNYADTVDKEYAAAHKGHTEALKNSKKEYLRIAWKKDKWKRAMLDALTFTLSSFGGGVAGKVLGTLATRQTVGGLISAKEYPVLFGGIESFGKDLEKAGVHALAQQFKPAEPVDIFKAVVADNASEQLSFLKPIEVNTDSLIKSWRALKDATNEGRLSIDLATKLVGVFRLHPMMASVPPDNALLQNKLRKKLERDMWLRWVLLLDRPYWMNVRAMLKASPENRKYYLPPGLNAFVDDFYDDLQSFKATRDRMESSGAFFPRECVLVVDWQSMDTVHSTFKYRAVCFANIMDIAVAELPINEVPAAWRTAPAVAAKVTPKTPQIEPPWAKYLPGYVAPQPARK